MQLPSNYELRPNVYMGASEYHRGISLLQIGRVPICYNLPYLFPPFRYEELYRNERLLNELVP